MKKFTFFATLLLSGLLFFTGCSESSGGSDGDNPVVVGEADATNVNTTLSALSPKEINTDTIIVVTLADSSGNLLPVGGDTVTMSSNSETSTISAVLDNGDGTYGFTATNTVAETVTYTGTVNGETITSTVDVVFTDSGPSTGVADATNENTTLSAPSPVEINENTVIVVTLADSSGNLLLVGGDTVTMSSNSEATTISGVLDNGDGTYAFIATNTVAETVTFTGTVNEATITHTADIVFVDSGVVRVADENKTTFSADLTTLPVYTYTTITVTLKDIDGIALTQGGDDVTLIASSSSVHVGLLEPTDNGDGTYTFTVTLERDLATDEEKKITYTALVNGAASPLESGILITYTEAVLVIGDANATTSVVEATTPVVANGEAHTTITVTLKDSNSNLLIVGGDIVDMNGTGSSIITGPTDNSNGTYTFTAINSVIETVTYTGTVNDVNITDTADVNFTDPNAPSAANSTVAATTPVVADGSSTTEITVTLIDGTGTPITSGGNTVTLTGTGSLIITGPTDNSNGTYSFTATNTVAETVTYTGALDGVTIDDTATVLFIAGAADVTTSTVTASPAEVKSDGIALATITVTLKDVNGNLLTAGTDDVNMTSSSADTDISPVTDNGNGTYTFTASNDVNGTVVTFTGTLDGSNITNTAEVLFTDNPASIVPADYVGNTVVFTGVDGEFSFYINNKFVKVSTGGVFEFIGTWDAGAIYDDKGVPIELTAVDSQDAIFHYTMVNGKNTKGIEEVQGFALREKLATRIEFVHFSDPPNQTIPADPATNPSFVWMYGYNTETNSSSEGHAKGTWSAVDGKVVATVGGEEFQTYAFDRGSVAGSIVTVTKSEELLKVIVIDEFYELHPGTELDYETEFTPALVDGTAFDGKMMTINSKVNGPASRYFEQRVLDDGSAPPEDVKDGYVDGIIWAVGITAAGETWGGKGDHWNTASDNMSLMVKVHYDGASGTPEKLEFDNGTPVPGNLTGMSRWEESIRNSGNFDTHLGTTTLDQVLDF